MKFLRIMIRKYKQWMMAVLLGVSAVAVSCRSAQDLAQVKDPTMDLTKLTRISDCKKVKDMRDNPLLLFANEWSIRLVLEHNEGLELTEFKKN